MRQPLSTMTKIAKAFTQCVTRTNSGWIVFRASAPEAATMTVSPVQGQNIWLAGREAKAARGRVDRPVAFAHDGEAFITREYGGSCASS